MDSLFDSSIVTRAQKGAKGILVDCSIINTIRKWTPADTSQGVVASGSVEFVEVVKSVVYVAT